MLQQLLTLLKDCSLIFKIKSIWNKLNEAINSSRSLQNEWLYVIVFTLFIIRKTHSFHISF